jgi:hypothetical protein
LSAEGGGGKPPLTGVWGLPALGGVSPRIELHPWVGGWDR